MLERFSAGATCIMHFIRGEIARLAWFALGATHQKDIPKQVSTKRKDCMNALMHYFCRLIYPMMTR